MYAVILPFEHYIVCLASISFRSLLAGWQCFDFVLLRQVEASDWNEVSLVGIVRKQVAIRVTL